MRRLVRDILSLTYVAGNGGYVADIGPSTFGEMLQFVEAPEFRRIEDLRAWASGARNDGPAAP